MYRCVATSLPGFIQQLAVGYVARGYWFYVKGRIPVSKDVESIDRKLIQKYGIDVSKWERSRRKKAGLANLHYLRFGRMFVLIATHGQHAFFDEEALALRDIRRVPFKHGGYAVTHRNGHASVRIDRETYKRLKAYLVDLAPRRSAEHMAEEFRLLDYEPYAPVRRQLLTLIRAVNRCRKKAGLGIIEPVYLRLKRRTYRPFSDSDKLDPKTLPAALIGGLSED